MKDALTPDDYREIGLDEPSECDMYVMRVKDFITDMPDNTVIKSHTREGTPLFKVTRWLGSDAIVVSVTRAVQADGGFHFCLEASVSKGKEESVCTISTWDFLPELDPLPELYDILREKFVRNCHKHFADALNRHKPPTE
jgi:hypothetical protein